MMSMSQMLGQFAASLTIDDVPSEVVEKARACVLNGYGIALGSMNTPYAEVASAASSVLYGHPERGATILLDGKRAPLDGALQANAALFHGRAQEDTCGTSHLGAILLPLLTGLAENGQGDMSEFLPALIAGYEVGGALEMQHSATTTGRGFRASPLYGTVAAAAAASRFMALPPRQAAAAIGNAASFAGGVLQSFADGSDEWRYQVGVAARLGLTAAMLARCGSVSAPNAIEGASGLIPSYAGEPCKVDAITHALGQQWSIMRVTFKPYPVCALNQTPVIAALQLRESAEFDAAQVEYVTVRMNPTAVGYAGMDAHGPFTTVSGTLMSVPFCIAVALLRGAPSMTAMTTYDDAEVNALEQRVNLVADDKYELLDCNIEIQKKSAGERISIDKRLGFEHYSYNRQQVSGLIRRIGDESEISEKIYERLEQFVEALPATNIERLLEVFATVRK